MKNSTPALWAYIFSIILVLFAEVFNCDLLLTLTKPIIIPAIFTYYFQTKKRPLNYGLFLILGLNFVTDMIFLIHFENEIYHAIYLKSISYIIFIYLILKDMQISKIKLSHFIYSFFILIGFFTLFYFMLDLLSTSNKILTFLFTFYGIILVLLSTIVGFNFMVLKNLKNTFAVIMCGCFIISDFCFAVHYKFNELPIFHYFNLAMQFLSYYYIIRYINTNNSVQNSFATY